jgi:hypothetical protein
MDDVRLPSKGDARRGGFCARSARCRNPRSQDPPRPPAAAAARWRGHRRPQHPRAAASLASVGPRRPVPHPESRYEPVLSAQLGEH